MEKHIQELYDAWKKQANADYDLITELEGIADNQNEITDRFYKDLEFGTGGLRGVIGAGTNRMNFYTVARVTQGICDYIYTLNHPHPAVAISYDSRNKSGFFAHTAAQVLAGNGITAYIFSELMPTPMLSFAVRHLKCAAGIMITASHNPSKYNGYKVYGADGCQLTLEASEIIEGRINKINFFSGIKLADFDEAFDKGTVTFISDLVITAYYDEVLKQSVHPDVCKNAGLKVVFTPLNGAGNKPVRKILYTVGVGSVIVVPEQERPNGNFPTCPYPNPEFKEALKLGLELCAKEQPDLLLATDPDCDRVGIAARAANGEYVLFSGNEVGALLLEYICRERSLNGTLPKGAVAVKSIVSTGIADKIAQKYGVTMLNVLTGFKFIGEQVGELEKKGKTEKFVFGFEESYGYLPGAYVRDKDAVSASMLICEMAAFYRSKGMSLIDARDSMYKEYGYYYHTLDNFAFEGQQGMNTMKTIMADLRAFTDTSIGGFRVIGFTDYLTGEHKDLLSGEVSETGLPFSDVVKFSLSGGSEIMARPSGTEPKLKIYYTAVDDSAAKAVNSQKKISSVISKIVTSRMMSFPM